MSLPPALVWPPPSLPQDTARCRQISKLLAQDAPTLFEKQGTVDLEVAEVSEDGTKTFVLETEEDLRKHLANVRWMREPSVPDNGGQDESFTKPAPIARYYLLEPSIGWAGLPISYLGIQDLLSTFSVFPEFYRHLSAFGQKGYPRDESFAAFNSAARCGEDGSLAKLEICYLLKYVGRRHEYSAGTNPWAVRHALVYQKMDVASGETVHILVRLSEAMKECLGSTVTGDADEAKGFAKDWTRLHAMHLGNLDGDIRQFINYLDEKVTQVFERLVLSGVDPDKLNEYDTPHSSTADTKALQYLQDQSQRVSHVISLNTETLGCLARQVEKLRGRFPPSLAAAAALDELADQIETTTQEHRFALANISAVIQRARSTAEQLRDTVSLRNSEISKRHTEAANRHARALAHLSEASRYEARVVKTLTVLAVVFVPASFAADFLQMGYLTVSNEKPMTWLADPGLQMYAILAVPLVTVTMLVYAVVEWLNKRKMASETGDGMV